MSTHEQISQAILDRGYRDCGDHNCCNPDCNNLLDHNAINLGFPGCMCKCRQCLESELHGDTIEYRIEKSRRSRIAYPTTGRITDDDPSIWGSAVLGYEGSTWESFNSRHHAPTVAVAEPYRRGIGQGFGSTEDGQEDVE